jgi:hypothetical protein
VGETTPGKLKILRAREFQATNRWPEKDSGIGTASFGKRAESANKRWFFDFRPFYVSAL